MCRMDWQLEGVHMFLILGQRHGNNKPLSETEFLSYNQWNHLNNVESNIRKHITHSQTQTHTQTDMQYDICMYYAHVDTDMLLIVSIVIVVVAACGYVFVRFCSYKGELLVVFPLFPCVSFDISHVGYNRVKNIFSIHRY